MVRLPFKFFEAKADAAVLSQRPLVLCKRDLRDKHTTSVVVVVIAAQGSDGLEKAGGEDVYEASFRLMLHGMPLL